MIDVLAAVPALILAPIWFWFGMVFEGRRNRRRDGALADCVECDYKSMPMPLSITMHAAKDHKEATKHLVLVVKA
ncbi:hypothetical protein [Arthrobacter sp. HLT1-21]